MAVAHFAIENEERECDCVFMTLEDYERRLLISFLDQSIDYLPQDATGYDEAVRLLGLLREYDR